ncbi:hypothetical protein [Pseudoalteromonas xiamenensis]
MNSTKNSFGKAGEVIEEEILEAQIQTQTRKVDRAISAIPLLIAIIVATAVYFYADVFHSMIPTPSEAKDIGELRGLFGTLGDFFGGVLNPAFTLITIVFLILSMRLQVQELRLTRLELKRSRESQENAVREAQEQNTINRQLAAATLQQANAIESQANIQHENMQQTRLHFLLEQINQTETEVNTLLDMDNGSSYKSRAYPRSSLISLRLETKGNKNKLTINAERIESKLLYQLRLLDGILVDNNKDPLTNFMVARVVAQIISYYTDHGFFVDGLSFVSVAGIMRRIGENLPPEIESSIGVKETVRKLYEENNALQ